MDRDDLDNFAPSYPSTKCGPECRYAQALPRDRGEWVWCEKTGAPRSIGRTAVCCRWFQPGTNGVRAVAAVTVAEVGENSE